MSFNMVLSLTLESNSQPYFFKGFICIFSLTLQFRMIAGGVVHKGGFQGFPEKSLKVD